MRRAIPLVTSALPIGARVPGQAPRAEKAVDLTVRGSNSGYMTVNLATGQAHALTTGDITHLGATTVEQDLQLVPTGPTTRSFTGTWTITVANGDRLFGTSSGTGTIVDSTHHTVVAHCISTGGTGPLADTSLTFDVTAEAIVLSVDGSLATQAIDVAVDGRFSH